MNIRGVLQHTEKLLSKKLSVSLCPRRCSVTLSINQAAEHVGFGIWGGLTMTMLIHDKTAVYKPVSYPQRLYDLGGKTGYTTKKK